MKRLLFPFITLISLHPLSAQLSHNGFDSLVITKIKKARYQMAHTTITNMDLKWKNPKRSTYDPNAAIGDVTRKLFTGIFGTDASSEDVTWELRQEIQTNTEDLDWRLTVYSTGVLEKTSEKVRNSDGTKSINTEKMALLFWDKGASAILLDKNDTIGEFMISVDRYDSLFRKAGEIFSERGPTIFDKRGQAISSGTHYVLAGNFRQQPLQIFFNGNSYKAWIYSDGKLLGVFQSDIIYEGKPSLLGPRGESTPVYLLCRPGLTAIESTDCIRLAAVSRLLATSVNTRSWERN